MTANEEIDIIAACCGELDKLPDALARNRVLEYLLDRYVTHPRPLPPEEKP